MKNSEDLQKRIAELVMAIDAGNPKPHARASTYYAAEESGLIEYVRGKPGKPGFWRKRVTDPSNT